MKQKQHRIRWRKALSLLLSILVTAQLAVPAVAVQAPPSHEEGFKQEEPLPTDIVQTEAPQEEPIQEEVQTDEVTPHSESSESTGAPTDEQPLPVAESSKFEYVEVTSPEELTSGGTYVLYYEQSNSLLYYGNGQDKVAQISAKRNGNKLELTNSKQFPEVNQTWSLQASEGTFTIQSCADTSKYLNLDQLSEKPGTNTQVVPVSATAQKLTLEPVSGGGFSVGCVVDGKPLYLAHANQGFHYIADKPCAFRIYKQTTPEQPPVPSDPLEIPGYKRVQTADLDVTKYYLIISQDSKGNLYALYPDKEHMNAPAGNAIGTEQDAGAFVANLTVSNTSFSAAHESDKKNIPTKQLRFVVTKRNNQYSFKGTNGMYLDLNDNMLSAARQYFTVTVNNGKFLLKSGKNRVLDFSKAGDANQFQNGFKTNFWGPSGTTATKCPIYLYEQIGTAYQPDITDQIGQDFSDMFAIDGTNNTNNTWMFDGGRVTRGSFEDIAGARSYVYQFEEFIRWTKASTREHWVTRQRYVFNVAQDGQTLEQSLAAFDARAKELDPRAAVYLVSKEDCAAGQAGIEQFKTNLTAYINKALTLRNNTGFAVIMTPYSSVENANLYAEAVKHVVQSVEASKLGRIQCVDLSTQTFPVNSNGTLTDKGHLEVGRALSDAVYGSTTDYPASSVPSNFPQLKRANVPQNYLKTPATVMAGENRLDVTLPNGVTEVTYELSTDRYTLTGEASGQFTLTNLPAGAAYTLMITSKDGTTRLPVMTGTVTKGTAGTVRTADKGILSDLITRTEPITWMFMGDSITHGAFHTCGYDSISQSFEKFLKDDLGRGKDLVLNTGVSSAATEDTLKYLNERLEKYHPDVVFLMLGTNCTNESNYKENMTQIVETIQKKGAIVVLRTPVCKGNDFDHFQKQATIVNEIATNKKLTVIDQQAETSRVLKTHPYLASMVFSKDNLHPNGIGHQWMLNMLLEGTGLAMDNSRIYNNAYDLGATQEKSDITAQVKVENNTAELDTAQLEKTYGKNFSEVTLTAINADNGLRYHVTVSGGEKAVLKGLPGDKTYTYEIQAQQKDSNTVVTFYGSDSTRPPLVNKDPLKEAIKKADQLDTKDYAEESKAVLADAVSAGKAELKRDDSTVASVATAVAAIHEAIQAMKPKAELMAPDRPNPDHGTTEGEPFPAGTGGSETFRIPALITLNDGSLAAAIDARWDNCPDGFGIDTLFSRSTDGGKTWHYNFPNYFNDSVDQYWGGGKNKGNATAFIDPVMVQDQDGTIYLMTDVYSGGTFIINAATDSGYEVIDGVERMAIHYSRDGKAGTYDFYVGDFVKADGEQTAYAPLIAKGDTTKSAAYYVDDHYNLYTANKQPMYCKQLGTHEQPWSGKYVQQNVFYYNAEVHVRRATFLWMVTSTDNGETWSAPTIMNPMVRERPARHRFYGVGPGAGLCLDDGTVMLPCYVHTPEHSSFIYKNPGDTTWHRSQDASKDNSSESALVQIDANTVRQFCRDGVNVLRYTDHKRNEKGEWIAQAPVTVPDAPKTTWNQLSAIRYSKDINGAPVIFVSTAATGSNGRFNGKIYAFALQKDADKTMKLIGTYEVNTQKDIYGYSSLTELPDGSIGLLYEDKWTHAAYRNILLNEIVPDAVVNGKRVVRLSLYETMADPFPFQTLPTKEELAQMDGEIATGEIINGKVVYTGHKVGQTSYTTGGITVIVEVTDPKQVKEVSLSIGQSEHIAVDSGEIIRNTNPTVVNAEIATDDKSLTVHGGQCHIGNDASYTGEQLPLAMGLHIFETVEGGFEIYAKDTDGSNLWMNPAGPLGHPVSAEPVQIQFEEQSDGTFFIQAAGRYLAFWRNGQNVFDAGSSASGNMTSLCKFKLYRPATAKDQSSTELPGYVQVTKQADLQSGGMYLIVAEYNHENFILWPSADNGSKFNHVAKVDPTADKVTHTVENKHYTLNLTGKTVGTSDVVVNHVVYRVTVTCDHSFGSEWKHDETNHWHECGCGETQDLAAHTFDEWSIRKQPTETEAGLQVHRCTVCGYEESVELPAAGEQTGTPDSSAHPNGGSSGHPTVNPHTGDSSHLALWFVLLAVAVVDLATTAVVNKKKHKN